MMRPCTAEGLLGIPGAATALHSSAGISSQWMPWQTWLAGTDQAAMHRRSSSGAWEQKGDGCFGSPLLPLGASDADNLTLSTPTTLCPEVHLPHRHEIPKKDDLSSSPTGHPAATQVLCMF